jgi:hypothetical protein
MIGDDELTRVKMVRVHAGVPENERDDLAGEALAETSEFVRGKWIDGAGNGDAID